MGEEILGGVGEGRFQARQQVVAFRHVDDERWRHEEPVSVAATVLPPRVEQQPVVEAVPEVANFPGRSVSARPAYDAG